METSSITRKIQPLFNSSYVKFEKTDDGIYYGTAFEHYRTLIDEISKELSKNLSEHFSYFYEVENLGKCLTIQIDTNIKLSDRLEE